MRLIRVYTFVLVGLFFAFATEGLAQTLLIVYQAPSWDYCPERIHHNFQSTINRSGTDIVSASTIDGWTLTNHYGIDIPFTFMRTSYPVGSEMNAIIHGTLSFSQGARNGTSMWDEYVPQTRAFQGQQSDT